jgi:hypothetical protein
MDSNPLHKQLNDGTRRKILLALNENGCLSYSDLMNQTKIEHTGRLNYHLKTLGDLLSKDTESRYVLSEKGKVAVQLLLDLPQERGQMHKDWLKANLFSKEEPNYLVITAFFWVTSSLLAFILVAVNGINLQTFIPSWIFFISGLFYLVKQYQRKKSKNS